MVLSAYRRLIHITAAHPAMVPSFQLRRGRSATTSSSLTHWRWYAHFKVINFASFWQCMLSDYC